MRSIRKLLIPGVDKQLLVKDATKLMPDLTRRRFIAGGASLGALTLLTGCDVSDSFSAESMLTRISKFNDAVQAAIFNPNTLAPEFPESAITKPFPFNAYLAKSPSNVTYSDPALAPGGGGPTPQLPGIPPSVSAYTGAGDMPPPPGWSDPAHPAGVYAPNGLPADPQPALFPGAPVPPGVPAAPVPPPVSRPANLQELLLPAEVPPAPQPAEGNP